MEPMGIGMFSSLIGLRLVGCCNACNGHLKLQRVVSLQGLVMAYSESRSCSEQIMYVQSPTAPRSAFLQPQAAVGESASGFARSASSKAPCAMSCLKTAAMACHGIRRRRSSRSAVHKLVNAREQSKHQICTAGVASFCSAGEGACCQDACTSRNKHQV